MTIAAWLIAMVGPMAARVLASMGFGLVALTGATVAIDTLKSSIKTYITGLPADALALGGLMGVWEAIAILLGAMTFCLTWKATAGFWTLARK
jgi:hypothetical protein